MGSSPPFVHSSGVTFFPGVLVCRVFFCVTAGETGRPLQLRVSSYLLVRHLPSIGREHIWTAVTKQHHENGPSAVWRLRIKASSA